MSPSSEEPPTLPPGLEPVRLPSGLEYVEIAAGAGAVACSGAKVRVHYTVWLAEGSLVDSTGQRGAPRDFVPGAGTVIPALEEGVLGLSAGGKRRLIVPSDLAYGPRGLAPRIPPYATLIVDLEVLAVG
ncbi:MAG: FKBP-type peptidyl-prolyl cis-trans isomerase [Candidatus Eiseniibacteriota bacterium]